MNPNLAVVESHITCQQSTAVELPYSYAVIITTRRFLLGMLINTLQ